MKKLAIIITHPIQYYVPLYELLAKSCNLKVFYTWGKNGAKEKYDHDFKQVIAWDLPLLNGYAYEFLENTAKDPGSHHFRGIVNPTLVGKINEFNPDAILVYGWAYLSNLKILRHFKSKTPLWLRGDSTLLDGQKGYKKVLRGLFLKWVYQHINKAFYVGSANKDYFKKFGLKDEQLIFAPHAVDNIRFQQDRKAEADALRSKLNIASDDILILFAGKLEAKKNPELLLKAFLEIREESEDSSQKYKEELEVGSPMSEDWVVKENALRQAQGDITTTNKEQGATTSNKQRMMSEDRSQRELEVGRPMSEDWVVKEKALRQAQGDITTTNKEQGATSNKQRMMSEDLSQKKLEVGRPRSEDWVVEESALGQAQGDSTSTNKEQGATSNKQRMMSQDRSQGSEAIFDKEKRKTKNARTFTYYLSAMES